jgi:hypothetical protein
MCFLNSSAKHLLIVAAIASVLLSSAVGQTAADEATVTGLVTDVHGLLVPGATVRISNRAITRLTKTTELGEFTLMVPSGTYLVTIEKPGFKSAKLKNVRVKPRVSNALRTQLKFGPAKTELIVKPST